MISRAASLLGIQPGEGRSASLMLLHSFAMGTGTVFFETAASALFLAHFGSSLLPWVYIAAAVFNTLTGVVYSTVQERVRFERLMSTTLALLLLFILSFRISLWASETGILVFSLLVFYRILSALTDLEYWAVATRLYDVRQAKRLFGMIGSGEVVARIVGSFSVAILVGRIGVANLLLVSAAGIAACLAVVVALTGGGAPAPARGTRRDAGRHAGGLKTLLAGSAGRYLASLLAITFFAILSKYFVDYAFLERMKARYDGATELASFFGIFSGVTQVLSLLTRLFVSGPVLSRFGIRAGLLVLPLTHVVCTAALALGGSFGVSGAAVFWLVMMNQGIYKTLKHPIDNPSFKVLYQPLRPEDRLGAQIAVETIVTPITTGIAGAMMLLFSVVIPYRPVHFAWVMLLVFAGWVMVARRAGSAYPTALSEALKGRIVDEEFSIDDERSLAVVREALGSDRPGDVVFALDLLEKTGHGDLLPNLLGLLSHGSPDVRVAVLSRIEARRLRSALEAVARRVEVEDSPPVRAAAVRCLCAIGGPGAVARVVPFLEHADPQVRKAAIVGLLREGGEGLTVAERRLAAFAGSRSADERAWAALVIGEAGRGDAQGLLRRLLEDDAPSVRRAALLAAGKAAASELLPVVVRHLGEPRYASVAALALSSAGAEVPHVLESAWMAETRGPVLERIARLWGRIGGPQATALLAERLRFHEERVRHAVLESLRQCGYRAAEGAGQAAIEAAIEAEAADAAWTLGALLDLEQDGRLLLLRSALERELAGNRQSVFLLLSFLHDPTAMLRARDHLADASKEKRAYALEILDVSLARETRELVFPLLEDLSLAERCARLEGRFPQQRMGTDERLRVVLQRSDEWLTPWTRACALYSVGILGIGELADRLWSARDGAGDALVRETAAWALVRLGRAPAAPAGGTRRRAMLTIEKVITLKAVPMFARTSEEMLADIAAILEEIEVKAGETIFQKGEVGDSLYIIVEGRVRVFDGDHTITRLGERDIFGELALLDPEPRAASIAAMEDTRLFRLDREAFSELMAGNIEIVRGVLSVLCERLRKQAS